jgi:hypothetical protein
MVTLDVIQVASPCTVAWDAMQGDDRVRFCSQCQLNVYNLSAMSRVEAESLVNAREGRTCVRFVRRADGTVLTQDCPVGLRAARQRLMRLWTAFVACLAGLLVGTLVNRQSREGTSLAPFISSGPMDRVAGWTENSFTIVGFFCPPTTSVPESSWSDAEARVQ